MNRDAFLVEIGTEELPPLALKKLSNAFVAQVEAGLKAAKVELGIIHPYASPRRLAMVIEDLAEKQPDQVVERQGPFMHLAYNDQGEPMPAALGFAKSCGVSLEEVAVIDTDKGQRLAFSATKSGKKVIDLLPDIVRQALKKLPVPKMMRWGDSDIEFIRPVHWVVMLYGSERIPCQILGKDTISFTYGHRFHCPDKIHIPHAKDYHARLETPGFVEVSFQRRQQRIKDGMMAITRELNVQPVMDKKLLDEVTSIVGWPTVLLCLFDEKYLSVPEEALISAMQKHQKCFPLKDKFGRLVNQYLVVSNIESKNPDSVVKGNEKVVQARLADAAFFYETDLKQNLDAYAQRLKAVSFQEQLGSLAEKSERIAILANTVAGVIEADETLATRAAELSKADLVTEMVGEFPDLQGIMGEYYALHYQEDAEVATAIKEQYWPKFAGDDVPKTKTGMAVAIADKLDTIIGIFGIGKKPSGSKDPYALRRAALGVLRIMVENKLPINLNALIVQAVDIYGDKLTAESVAKIVFEFFVERFKAWYQERGLAVDTFMAVASLEVSSPFDFDCRVKAVQKFRAHAEAESLAMANKRVHNILSKEGAKDLPDLQTNLLEEPAERTLHQVLQDMAQALDPLKAHLNYEEMLDQLATLKPVIDSFFEHVMVMVDDEALKLNRLALLSQLRGLFLQVADISLLQI